MFLPKICPLLFPIGSPTAKPSYSHSSKQNPQLMLTSPNSVSETATNQNGSCLPLLSPQNPPEVAQHLHTWVSAPFVQGDTAQFSQYSPLLCISQEIRFFRTTDRKSNIFMVLILPRGLLLSYQNDVPEHKFQKKRAQSEVGTSWLQHITAQVTLSTTIEETFSNHLVGKETETQKVYTNCWRSHSWQHSHHLNLCHSDSKYYDLLTNITLICYNTITFYNNFMSIDLFKDCALYGMHFTIVLYIFHILYGSYVTLGKIFYHL